jgi:hypothetical protein
MQAQDDIVRDARGTPMFICPSCGEALRQTDVFDHGLRLPDYGETRDDYLEAELLDELQHYDCLRAKRAC